MRMCPKQNVSLSPFILSPRKSPISLSHPCIIPDYCISLQINIKTNPHQNSQIIPLKQPPSLSKEFFVNFRGRRESILTVCWWLSSQIINCYILYLARMNMATNGMQVGITYTLTPSLFLGGQPLLYSPALLHAQLPSEREINLETSFKELQDKYQALLLENQDLKNKLEESSKKTSSEEGNTQNACARRSFVRRTEDQLDKKFKCCFDHCKKEYASTLALNLHIKNKHHGATKKQMDDHARKVIEAELRGEQPPSLPFALPQGYLDKLRKEYTAAPSTSEDMASLQQ